MQRRMSQLKKREKRMDVDAWVQSFLHTMGAIFDDKVRLNFEDRATCAVNNALKILSGRELSLQTDDP